VQDGLPVADGLPLVPDDLRLVDEKLSQRAWLLQDD
jgi:hypothetical protein